MKKCYSFCGTEKCGQFSAKLPDDAKITNLEMDDYLLKEKKFPCKLVLKPFKKKNVPPVVWHDYMYNEFAYFMVSKRLKEFLVEFSTKNDNIEWISVNIRHNDIVKTYYVITFQEVPDVLDLANTTFLPNSDFLLVPCIAAEKAENYSVFPLRMPHFPSLLHTTEKIKNELRKEKFSNLKFEKTKTSLNGVVMK